MEALANRLSNVSGTRSLIAGGTYGTLHFLRYRDRKNALDTSSIVSATTLISDYLVAMVNVDDQPHMTAMLNGGLYTLVQSMMGDNSYLFNFASVAAIDYVVELGHSEIKKYSKDK